MAAIHPNESAGPPQTELPTRAQVRVCPLQCLIKQRCTECRAKCCTAHRTYVLFNVHNLVRLMPSSCPAWGDQRPERKRDSPRISSEQQIQGSHQVCLTPKPVPLTLLLPWCSDTSNFKPHKPQNNSLLLLSTIKTMGWHNRKTVQYVIKHNCWCPLIVWENKFLSVDKL